MSQDIVEPGDPGAGAKVVASAAPRRVLHVGCGPIRPGRLHDAFASPHWVEVRLDLDPAVRPDIVASLADMGAVGDGSVQALWSSHSLEHLDGFEVPVALAEFVRVLAPDGFAVMLTPDLAQVARAIQAGYADEVAYQSPAGPVTPIDMLYGCGPAIGRGNRFMRHHTGFTRERLARLCLEAGFDEVRVVARNWELCALALKGEADRDDAVRLMERAGVSFEDHAHR